jgi:hypothetical protein
MEAGDAEMSVGEVNKRIAGLKNTPELEFRSSDQLLLMEIIVQLERMNKSLSEISTQLREKKVTE